MWAITDFVSRSFRVHLCYFTDSSRRRKCAVTSNSARLLQYCAFTSDTDSDTSHEVTFTSISCEYFKQRLFTSSKKGLLHECNVLLQDGDGLLRDRDVYFNVGGQLLHCGLVTSYCVADTS